NPHFQDAETQVREAQDAARALGLPLRVLRATTEPEIDTAFVTFAKQEARALLIANEGFFNTRRQYLATPAARHSIPAIHSDPDYVTAGGLVSYAPSLVDAYRQAGLYTGKILKGARPADLPVLQPTKFELVINLKTAKALELTIPP